MAYSFQKIEFSFYYIHFKSLNDVIHVRTLRHFSDDVA